MTPATDPRSFDRFAADYDRFVGLLPGQHTSWLTDLGRSGERALDAGCGSGRELYGNVFPGARFDDLGFALAMVWTAPAQ